MKVCILSMQRVGNMGSLLQSYALKTTIERLGHQVEFIDIEKREDDHKLLGDYKQKYDKEKERKPSDFLFCHAGCTDEFDTVLLFFTLFNDCIDFYYDDVLS